MPSFTFTHAWYLLLLLPAVLFTLRLQRASLAGLDQRRGRAVLVIRLLLLACMIASLAGPVFSFPARSLQVLFLLDRSVSVPPDAQARQLALVNDVAQHLPSNAKAGVAVFGRETVQELEPSAAPYVQRIHSRLPADGTDLAGAIRAGVALLPDDVQRRLMLVSDGNSTTGDALQEAAAAGASGTEVDVIPVEHHYPREVLLEKLLAPEAAKRGEPVEIRVVARSTAATSARVRLLRDGVQVAEQAWQLRPGPNTLWFSQTLMQPGFHTWEALLETRSDTIPDNNRALGFTQVAGTPRVLLVDGSAGASGALAPILRGHSLQVDERGPEALPSTLAQLQNYDTVILNDIRADQVSPDGMRLLQSGVQDLGIGLVMVGGPDSLTAGGWHGTPVEAALPVDMQARRRQHEAEVALVLVLDRSGSMGATLGGRPKLAFAQAAAEAAVGALRPDDQVGVVAFDSAPEWVVPLGPRGEGAAARHGIETISALGGTSISPALEEAEAALRRSRAAVKHILLLTDGQSTPGDWDALTRRLKTDRITLSTVGVGRDADARLLIRLAQGAGGRYYGAQRGEALPSIFDRETRLVSRAALVEEPFTPRVEGNSPLLRGLPAPPPLLGYVATTEKEAPGVEVPLRSQKGDPVLAAWRYGLGRAVAVTTDAQPRWAAPWLAGGGDYFSRFWAQVVRSTIRATGESDLRPQVEITGGEGRVTVDALTPSGEFRNNLSLTGRVSGPAGGHALRLEQTGPGHYEGRFPAPARGQYLVALSAAGAGTPEHLTVAGAAVPYSPELRNLDTNTPLLLQIAERSGGHAWPSLGPALHAQMLPRLFRPGKPARTAPQEVWPYLVLAGALLMPLDVGLRRVTVNRREFAAAVGVVLGPVTARFSRRERQTGLQDAAVGRLLEAKGRVLPRVAPSTEAPTHPAEPAPPVETTAAKIPPAAARPRETAPPAPTSEPEPGESRTERLLAAKRRANRESERE